MGYDSNDMYIICPQAVVHRVQSCSTSAEERDRCVQEENQENEKVKDNQLESTRFLKNEKQLFTENKALRSEIEAMKYQQEEFVLKTENEMKRLTQESDELKSRLSKMASDRLTDNNPNIADLSDENRAIKVGEKFSELYSNEWSDAFEDLTEKCDRKESQAIQTLLDILLAIFKACRGNAEMHSHHLEEAILKFTGNKKLNKSLAASLKVYKDERKRNYKSTVPCISTITEEVIPLEEERTYKMKIYVETAIEICWLMCIQDPPLSLYTKSKGKFDEGYFSPYTVSGRRVAYLVWPALLLHEGGPILQKGVAQGRKSKKERKTLALVRHTNDENTSPHESINLSRLENEKQNSEYVDQTEQNQTSQPRVRNQSFMLNAHEQVSLKGTFTSLPSKKPDSTDGKEDFHKKFSNNSPWRSIEPLREDETADGTPKSKTYPCPKQKPARSAKTDMFDLKHGDVITVKRK
ncbi:uncharacterized protein LOC123547839 [Mercenaria mercenaria]|uniref:uncharacterized protein LOC123547839 n=1 Tax=Mercenaria mercenaria TaxID=6596 RepID=UPI00234E5B27|nr:uncharacterized protein LOC123547839 [Mercenaria mercenaria]